ncbi:SNF2 family N-terminal domain-containing protein [Kalaharituber pfeilii]|nr:SNF2 family N-terminal domain-containing protein [Kalaharituber pfeilii]
MTIASQTTGSSQQAPQSAPGPARFRSNHTASTYELSEDDDALALEVVDLTQGTDKEDLAFLGTLPLNVVGVRYYNGITTPGEQVLLEREPSNIYDRNAIRVLNVMREQVGHIPRTIAAKLAPLMDRRQIQIEGTVSGLKGAFELPITVDVYAFSDDEATHSNMIAELRRGGVYFSIESAARRVDALQALNKRRADPERSHSAKRPRTAVSQPGPMVGPSHRPVEGFLPPLGISSQASLPRNYNLPSLRHIPEVVEAANIQSPSYPRIEEIVQSSEKLNPRDIGTVLEKFGMSEQDLEKMHMASQPSSLSISLLPYQRQGLQWLLEHESPKLPTQPGEVVQFWKVSPMRAGTYINVATNFVPKEPPALVSGGILADDMGLGKTVQMISLILSDIEKKGKSVECAGTLIVAPVSVMSNWEDQLQKHIKPENALSVRRYHGAGRKGDLISQDVVITSYGTLTSEHDAFKQKKSSSIFNLKWRRVILDEAHIIRNPKAKASLAASEVQAQSRWALTGTPIVNNLSDLFSLIRFLGFSGGIAVSEIFRRAFIRPINDGNELGTTRLQAIIATTCLRRRKEMKFVKLGIPELKEYIHKIKLSPEEREKYDMLQNEARYLLERYEKSRAAGIQSAQNPLLQAMQRPTPQNIQHVGGSQPSPSQSQTSITQEPVRANDPYSGLLERLLRMRQMCNHPLLCGSERIQAIEERLAELSGGGLSNEMRGLLQEILQLAIDSQEDCPICLDTLHNPRITICKHIFGEECITRVIEQQRKCPMCRTELPEATASTLIKPYSEVKHSQFHALVDGTILPPSSSKVDALITILNATRQNDPTSKTIVFSQWTKYLDIVGPHLTFNGFRFCRIDGSMQIQQRDYAIARLSLPQDHPDAVDVMLASLTVASVGLNLVAANQVILADSWWAPAIEDQAVDRVHRLGQKRETTVWRLVVEGSIEERVLQVQELKRELIGRAFGEDEGAEGREGGIRRRARRGKGKETRLADLQMLLRGAVGPAQS